VHSFIEPDILDNRTVHCWTLPLLDNTTPFYLINLLWKLQLGLGLNLKSCIMLAFFTENNENEHLIFRKFYGR